jgi:cell division protein ZapA (FtsZ GTPase activity inhibitor)
VGYDEDRINRVNSLMNDINSACDDIHEGMIDQDYVSVIASINTLLELIDYLKKSVSNEF